MRSRRVSPLLCDIVAAQCGRYPKLPRDILDGVRAEYGNVSRRHVAFALAALRRTGRIRRAGFVDRGGRVSNMVDGSGYVRGQEAQT